MYDFDSIMKRMLERVPAGIDKRQGSIVYDALAPAAAELAQLYIELDIRDEQSYLLTASGDALDRRAADFGVYRYGASCAVRLAEMRTESGELMDIPEGTRFSTPNEKKGLNYVVTERVSTGVYALTCETPGTVGNEYFGDLLPLTYLNTLGSASMEGTRVAARDDEQDEDFRVRVLEVINRKSFGGNISDYREKVRALDGVGELQVYPVWNGGGTVKLAVVDPEFMPLTAESLRVIAEQIDPENNGGQGLGLAPIGHMVTVSAPEPLTVDIEAGVTPHTGYTAGRVLPDVREAIEGYFYELRKQWARADELGRYSLAVYVARVNAAVVSVDGVINVADTAINGARADLRLREDALLQQMPVLGEVILHEIA